MNKITADAGGQFDQSFSDDQRVVMITGGVVGIEKTIIRRLSADMFMIVIADL